VTYNNAISNQSGQDFTGQTPVLSITPAFRNISEASVTTTFDVANAGAGTMSWSATANNSWLTIVGGTAGSNSGTVTISCEANVGAERTGTITVTAAGATNSPQTVEIRQALGFNDPPTISDIPDQSVNVNSVTSSISFTIGDTESEAGLLTVSASSSDSTLVPESNIILAGTGTDRTIKIVPADNQTGKAVITVTVSDGKETAGDTFEITVGEVNDGRILSVTPVLRDVPATSGTTTFDVANTGAGTMNWSATANDSWLTIADGDSGTDSGTITMNYDANPGAERTGTVTITATDAENSPQTVEMNQAAFIPVGISAPFSSVWSSENPYNPMNIWVTQATLDGIDLEAGDVIGIFDGESCVGVKELEGPIVTPLNIIVGADDPDTPETDGFADGNTIICRFWKHSTSTGFPVVTSEYSQGDGTFATRGTAVVALSGKTDEQIYIGDINHSGTIDLRDAILVLKVVVGMDPSEIFSDADINGDGKIGLAEVIHILQAVSVIPMAE